VQIAVAAIAGGAAIALTAAVVLGALRNVDVAGFYPSALHASAWHWQDGSFANHAQGLVVDADGTPTRVGPRIEARPLAGIPRGGRAAASMATALAGVALPMLLAQLLLARHAGPTAAERLGAGRTASMARWQAVVASAAAIVGSMMLFQAAAARLVPALTAALPPAALLVFALGRYRASS